VDLNAGCRVHADRRHGQDGLGHVGRVEAASQNDRDLSCHGGRYLAGDLTAGPSRERASGGIEKEPLGAGPKVRLACLDSPCGH
jgi:hypothetical protein